MTVIKINAITVPEDAGERIGETILARSRRWTTRRVSRAFELLRPTDGRNQWLVVTRWADEESFLAWVKSPAFAHGHAGADRPSPHGGPVSVSSEALVLRRRRRVERVLERDLKAARNRGPKWRPLRIEGPIPTTASPHEACSSVGALIGADSGRKGRIRSEQAARRPIRGESS